jgi:hypothetical protein
MRHAGETASQDGSGGGIRGNNEIARGTKDGEGDQREQERIQARDYRSAGDFCITQRLGNVHRRQGNPSKQIPGNFGPMAGAQSLEHGEFLFGRVTVGFAIWHEETFPAASYNSDQRANC